MIGDISPCALRCSLELISALLRHLSRKVGKEERRVEIRNNKGWQLGVFSYKAKESSMRITTPWAGHLKEDEMNEHRPRATGRTLRARFTLPSRKFVSLSPDLRSRHSRRTPLTVTWFSQRSTSISAVRCCCSTYSGPHTRRQRSPALSDDVDAMNEHLRFSTGQPKERANATNGNIRRGERREQDQKPVPLS